MIRRIASSTLATIAVWTALAVIDRSAAFHLLGIVTFSLVAAASQTSFAPGWRSVVAAPAGVVLVFAITLGLDQPYVVAWILTGAAAAGLAAIAVLPTQALAIRTFPSVRADRWLWARYPFTTAFAVFGLWFMAGGTSALAAVLIAIAVLACASFANVVGASRIQVTLAAGITTAVLAIAFGSTAESVEVAIRACVAGAVLTAWVASRMPQVRAAIESVPAPILVPTT